MPPMYPLLPSSEPRPGHLFLRFLPDYTSPMRPLLCLCAALLLASIAAARQPDATPAPGAAPDIIAKAISYLRAHQDEKTGGWSVPEQGPAFPAITALVVSGMRCNDSVPASDPAIKRAVDFILSRQQPDGGIYDSILPSYNTAISICGLAHSDDPRAPDAIRKAAAFLKSLQFGEDAVERSDVPDSAKVVTRDHPFYGGWGYGRSARPDLSNTAFALEALHTAGVDPADPAFQRALVFLQRCQMLDKAPGGMSVNDMPYAAGSRQGGFIYSTSPDKDSLGKGISYAQTIDETLDDGTKISRLRSYGSMSCSGFKSYLYAGLAPSDPRVTAARDWISRNYTLAENPGVGTDGLYYYFVVFSRALKANGSPTLTVFTTGDTPEQRDWASDLAARLAELQQPDGSFTIVDDRWMENNPVLITAYSLLALQQAR